MPQGDANVDVEVRGDDHEAFGQGRKQRMTVAAFLDRLQRGGERLYLSTQNAATDRDGHPALLTPPLARVPGLPLKPAIMGALVPQAINLWIGRSARGTSSGLHHDFHDNLYVLLSGTKRFRLFPPALARRMYTHGEVQAVHSNGRCATHRSAARQ
jgi:Cupin-like domain